MRQWIRNINRKNWKPSHNSRICALHFTEECFHTGSGRRHLNSTAVPTIFAFHSCSTTSETQVVSTHKEVSETVYFDHTYFGTAVSTPTSGEVTKSDSEMKVTSTEVRYVVMMDHQYSTTAVTKIHKGDSVTEVLDGNVDTVMEVSDGNEDIVMEEVHDDINFMSDAVLHHNDVTLEHHVEDSQVQHTALSDGISVTVDHSYLGVSPKTMKRKLCGKKLEKHWTPAVKN